MLSIIKNLASFSLGIVTLFRIKVDRFNFKENLEVNGFILSLVKHNIGMN